MRLNLSVTLNRTTSSMVAGLPAPTQEWKKDGATETPKASEVIPLLETPVGDRDDTARKVPKSSTSNCCVHFGNSPMILLRKGIGQLPLMSFN